MSVHSLARSLPVETLAPQQIRLIAALRLWAIAVRMRWCPIRAVAARLGGSHAAAHLGLMIEEIGAAWPDPFCVSPPCSPRLSHDEATLAGMMALAGRNDRPGFDRLLADLLPADERERLYFSASVLSRFLGE